MKNLKRLSILLSLLVVCALLFSCGKGQTDATTGTDNGAGTSAETTGIDPIDAPFDLVSTADPIFDYFGADLSGYLTLARDDYAGISVALDITDDEVEEYINDYLLPSNRTPIKATDRAVADGDTAFIYYTGYVDDVAFEGGSNAEDDEPYPLVIGSGSFIPGFEEALIGLIPSETSKEAPHPIAVTFPENYKNADLAGKEARFDIWLVGILDGYETPEMTPAFVTDVLGFETEETDVVAAFRAHLKDEMRKNKVENLTAHKLIRTMEELFKTLSFSETLPEGEADRVETAMNDEVVYYYQYYNYMSYMYYGKIYFEDLDEAGRWYYGLGPDADWEAFQHTEAERVVRQNILLAAIARLEEFTISEDEAKEWVREQARNNDVTPAEVLDHYSLEEVYLKIASGRAQELLLDAIDFDYGELPIGTDETPEETPDETAPEN